MQNRFDNHYTYFYLDSKGNRRKYGIYSPGLDRFLSVDENDIWVSLQAAEMLSSKIPVLLYVLPTELNGLNNSNCLEYGIFNKLNQKIQGSNILVGRQSPMIKFLYDDDLIYNFGMHKEFNDVGNKKEILNLKNFSDYLLEQSYAVNLAEAFYNPFNIGKILEQYLHEEDYKNIDSKRDNSKTKNGIFKELRNIMYLSKDISDAETKIIDFWKNNFHDVGHVIKGYYKILDKPVPKELEDIMKHTLTDFSPFLF
jgi:hypothetical protein